LFGQFQHSIGYPIGRRVLERSIISHESLGEKLSQIRFHNDSVGTHTMMAFKTLWKFKQQYGVLPRIRCEEDALLFLELAKSDVVAPYLGLRRAPPLDETLLCNFSKTAVGQISPMTTLFGGFAAQEVLKACTGLYFPGRDTGILDQFVIYSALDWLFDPSINADKPT
jgi:hypothetical protein